MPKPKKMSTIQKLWYRVEKMIEPILYSRLLNKQLALILRKFSLSNLTKYLEDLGDFL
jgi:hypothetical protein